MKNKLKALPHKIMHFLYATRIYTTSAIILVLFGYVAWQVQGIAKPPIDETRLDERTNELRSKRVQFDDETIDEVLHRSREGPSTIPTSSGDSNPFD